MGTTAGRVESEVFTLQVAPKEPRRASRRRACDRIAESPPLVACDPAP
jgi:hypothetical protein